MDWVVGVLAFAAVALAVLGISSVLQAPAADRLKRVSQPATPQPQRESGSLLIRRDTGLTALFARLGGRDRSSQGPLRERLSHAGFRQYSAPAVYFGIRLTLAIGMPVTAALFPALWSLPFLTSAALLCGVGAVGYVAPSAVLDRLVSSRQRGIERALPDALDLLVVCVEAGYGINQALSRIAEDFASRSVVLAQEFALIVNETRTGKTTTAALQGLADRTGVSDVTSLVALLVQTEKFGTSVASALRVHADAMRVQRMQRAEERAQMATLKLIFPSTLIFAALLILFIAPAALRVLDAMK